MFHELTNQPRPYQWGDSHSIAQWQGRVPSGDPEAELWLGTHPGSEAHITEDSGELKPLSVWLAQQGMHTALPFLVKLLAASTPLSIQVHPTTQQARAGFALDNDAGLALDDPRRNYRDDSDKPEILIAWSEQFLALAGLQAPQAMASTLELMESLVPDSSLVTPARVALEGGSEAFGRWLFSEEQSVTDLAHAITGAWESGVVLSRVATDLDLVRVWDRVVSHYPGDPGIVAASFLNLVSLSRGEAVFLPAGIPHAYLHGFGLEVMAPSDNVLRGGLTPKHIDRVELQKILDSRPFTDARFEPKPLGISGLVFAPAGVPFTIQHAEGTEAEVQISSAQPVIVVIESGSFSPDASTPGLTDPSVLQGGKAYLGVVPDTGVVLRGSGSIFVVAAG
jgi:mannose-6-phosphate isomerase